MNAAEQIESELKALAQNYLQKFSSSQNADELISLKADLLGKEGHLDQLLKLMKDIEPNERKEIGKNINTFKVEAEQVFQSCLKEM